MRLAAVRIFVTDLVRSSEWYRHLVGSEPTAGSPASGYVVFAVGADLVLETVGDDSDVPAEMLVGRFTGLSLAVDDVRAALPGLADTVDVVGEPELHSWGGTLATIADPDGNQLQLVQYP
jgi:catechol 2,3-dioxygenase-like lactoylglutathione lyase family enzyme